jgi:hypothetical protein
MIHHRLPEGMEKWNRALRGVYLKGREACLKGVPQYQCPYADKKNGRNRITWSRSFVIAWHNGYSDMSDILEEQETAARS